MNDRLDKLKLLNKANWPYGYIAIDANRRLAKLIGNKAIPETIIINPQGKVAMRYIGGLDESLVTQQLIPLLKTMENK